MGGGNPEEHPVHKAQDVRGGEIILRTRLRRIVFAAGLAGIVLIGMLLWIAA